MIEIGDILNVDIIFMLSYIIGLVDEIIIEIMNFFIVSGGMVG